MRWGPGRGSTSVSEAMIELFSEARLPEEPRLREIVEEIALGIVDTIDRAFSEDADSDSDGDGNQGESERN